MNSRILKINAEIQKAISEIITYEMHNPKINGIISVTKVDTTCDLDYCKVYISTLFKENRQEIFDEIKRSAGFIRRELCKKVILRKAPLLEFILDETLDNAEKIDALVERIKSEKKVNENEDI